MQRCWQELNIDKIMGQQTEWEYLCIYVASVVWVLAGFGPVIWGNFCHQGQGFMGFLIKETAIKTQSSMKAFTLEACVYHNWKDKKQLNIVLAQRDMQIHETGHIFKLSKF